MKESGKIIKILRADLVEVTLQKSGACAHGCACKLQVEGEGMIEADNPIGAKLGQSVEIEISDRLLVLHYLVIFLLPIVFLVIGCLSGAFLWGELGGVILGFNFLVLSFLLIKWYDIWARQKAQVVRILE